MTAPLPLLASEFNVLPGDCLLLLLFVLWPLVPLVLAARSLLSPEPVSRFVLALTVAGTAVFAYYALPMGPLSRHLLGAWWYAGLVAILLTPVAALREGNKRGWFRSSHRRKRRRADRGRGVSDRDGSGRVG